MKKPARTQKRTTPALEITDAAAIATSLSGMMTDPITGDVKPREGDVEFSEPHKSLGPAKRKARKQNRSRKIKRARPKQKRK
jgi:hypothetical protein